MTSQSLCRRCRNDQVPFTIHNKPRSICNSCKAQRKERQAARALERYYRNHNKNKKKARLRSKNKYHEDKLTEKIILANDLLVVSKVCA